jgi:hypothetical protein
VNQTSTEQNKAVILEVLTTAFNSGKDFTALEKYVHPDFAQHNPTIPGGRDGLRSYAASPPDMLRYEPGAIVAEGDGQADRAGCGAGWPGQGARPSPRKRCSTRRTHFHPPPSTTSAPTAGTDTPDRDTPPPASNGRLTYPAAPPIRPNSATSRHVFR